MATYTLKDKIFGFFGVNAKVKDTNKDVNGKGINERSAESIGEDYDEELGPLIDNFHDNVLVPKTCLARMIPYIEDSLGQPLVVLDNETMRRRVLRFAHRLNEIKTTALGYEVPLRWLGFETVTIESFVKASGFDSDLTWDAPERKFDGGSTGTSRGYSLLLTGGITITQEIYDAVFRICAWNQPAGVTLREVLYNGSPISV